MMLEDGLNNFLIISKVRNRIFGFQFENDILCRIYDFQSESPVGNIYLGYVKDVVRNINAAFVEFDGEHKGFLSLTGIPFPVKQGDKLLVQVSGDKVKSKDYLLTWKLNIPSDALVLTVGDTGINISKKIKDKDIRKKLRDSLLKLTDETYGFIIRTKAVTYTLDELKKEAEKLRIQYGEYQKKAMHLKPKTIIAKKNYIVDICKAFMKEQNGTILTDVETMYNELSMNHIPVLWNDDSKISLANKYALEKHIQNATNRHVWLKSGAYLVIEHTEAMTVIDVNSGKADMHTNRKKTILKINQEAASEIARQLKIRNISGTILVDFINMDKVYYDELLNDMRLYTASDFTLCSVVDITKLGLMEITRKKQQKPLREILE